MILRKVRFPIGLLLIIVLYFIAFWIIPNDFVKTFIDSIFTTIPSSIPFSESDRDIPSFNSFLDCEMTDDSTMMCVKSNSTFDGVMTPSTSRFIRKGDNSGSWIALHNNGHLYILVDYVWYLISVGKVSSFSLGSDDIFAYIPLETKEIQQKICQISSIGEISGCVTFCNTNFCSIIKVINSHNIMCMGTGGAIYWLNGGYPSGKWIKI